MSDEQAKTEWGKERRSRRREFSEQDTLKKIDRRGTRTARYKARDVHVRMSEEGFAMMEAKRALMNFGGGMSQGEYLEYLVRWHNVKSPRAKEARKAWAIEHHGDAGPEAEA